MKIKTLKNVILGLEIRPAGTILEIGRDIAEIDAQRLIGFGDEVELLPEVDEVPQPQTKILATGNTSYSKKKKKAAAPASTPKNRKNKQ